MEKNVEKGDFENQVDDSHQLTLEVQGRSEKTIMTMTILNQVDYDPLHDDDMHQCILCGSADNDDGDQFSDHYDCFYHVTTQVVLEGAEGTL